MFDTEVTSSSPPHDSLSSFVSGDNDISNSIVPISREQAQVAVGNGVGYVEIPVAMTAVAVFTHQSNDFVNCLTTEQLRALFDYGGDVKTWQDIDPSWPDRHIELAGPIEPGIASAYRQLVFSDAAAGSAWTRGFARDSDLVRHIIDNRNSLGLADFAYRWDSAKALAVDAGDGCVVLSRKTIADGSYPLNFGPVLAYVNRSSLKRPEVMVFLTHWMENGRRIAGSAGYLPLTYGQYRHNLKLLFACPQAAGGAGAAPDGCPEATAPETVDAALNPGLQHDREVLLSLRDELAGDATLNWSANRRIREWEGLSFSGSPSRVTGIVLQERGLNGTVPVPLAQLTELTTLDLRGNELTGSIPAELGCRGQFQRLNLADNPLTGAVPSPLRNVPENDLADLDLPDGPANCGAASARPDANLYPELATDFDILLALRDDLRGHETLNWNEITPITEWDGVKIGGDPIRVTELKFENVRVRGVIPPEIGALTGLRHLDLSFHDLTGPRPKELGNLTNLVWLYLRSNNLEGGIPPEMGNLVNLRNLWLSDNQLTGTIPPELGRLSSLASLLLGYNELNGEIPSELGGLTNILEIRLSGNNLTGVMPIELAGLQKLESLHLTFNDLSGNIPSELGNLEHLRWLALGHNRFERELPKDLAKLEQLEILDLGYNELAGEIPAELGNLARLSSLDLSGNSLSGQIPLELSQLQSLTWLELSHNELTGEIPLSLGKLANLHYLSLQENQLTGSIPPELVRLPKLDWIYLGGNAFTGCIPKDAWDISHHDLDELGLPTCP